MSDSSAPHRVLHLVIEGFPAERLPELTSPADGVTEVFQFTEANASEALQKIFAADTVAVWGAL